MAIISIDVFAPVDNRLPQLAMDTVQRYAATYLHFDLAQTVTKVRFSAPDEQWFFRSHPLNRATEPAFHIVVFIIKENTTGQDRADFLLNTLTELKAVFTQIYPVHFPGGLDERNKITLLDVT